MTKQKMTTTVQVPKTLLEKARSEGNILMSDPCAFAGDRIRHIRKAVGCSAVMIEDTAVIDEKEYTYFVNVEWYEND